jgi:hypothetical protein
VRQSNATRLVISLARYAALLEPRDLKQTIAASMIGRLPIGITGLAAAVAPALGRLIG